MMMDDEILDSELMGYMNPSIKKVDSKNQFNRWHNAKKEDPKVIDFIKNQHDFHVTIVQKMHEAGVTIVCGTDGGIGVTLPGFSIHNELEFYSEAGLSNYEVLKTATVNAAQVHSFLNSMGTIEPGKTANLVLLENNPLSELSALKNPSHVFINGRKLDRAQLNMFNEKAMNRKNFLASVLRYVENLLIER